MSTDFTTVADDFFVNVSIQTTMSMPESRESILHFCEAVQKEFPDMTCFYQRDTGEYVLEGDRDAGSYRWLELQARRLSAGVFNPPSPAMAYQLHRWLIDRSLYFLGMSGLDVDCLDVMFGFNMDFQGNRDAIVADALYGGSAMGAIASLGSSVPVECEPSMVIALDENCYLQARLSVETRSSSYQVRTGKYDEEPISVYFTVRRYPQPGRLMQLKPAYDEQIQICEELADRMIVPNIIKPITTAIASAG